MLFRSRGWVLDVAARAGDGRAQAERANLIDVARPDDDVPDGGGRGDGRRRVDAVLHQDRDDRCAIVKLSELGSGTSQSHRPSQRSAVDDEVWMLINADSQQSTRYNTSVSKLDMIQPGVELVIKGGRAMRWTVDFDQGLDNLVCHVAVFWDVVQH